MSSGPCHGTLSGLSEERGRKNGGGGKRENDEHLTNHIIFSSFRFVLAGEHGYWPWYISEKVINAILAGSIPIYLGSVSPY